MKLAAEFSHIQGKHIQFNFGADIMHVERLTTRRRISLRPCDVEHIHQKMVYGERIMQQQGGW
jgi:hypothetical protein